MPQLRQNIITGEWVVFAPERAKRPSDYVSVSTEKKRSGGECPFCEDSANSAYKERHEKFDGKYVYVIPNKFPAFVERPELCDPKKYKIEDEFYGMKMALGGHDVIVVRDCDQELPKFTQEIWEDLLRAIDERYNYFKNICNVEYVMPIYNHGPQAAASIEHPHAQIFASSVVPNDVTRELTHTAGYYEREKSCAFCDLIAHEKKQNTRVLFETDDFIAFTFYAARFPFEIWVMPKKHSSDFYKLTAPMKAELAKILRQTFSRLDETLNDPSLNFYIHSAPVKKDGENLDYYHWHIEITPRLSLYGGYELGSGMVIDIITPEAAAEYLRLGKQTTAKN
jgi:UDPglucose--hexose-1-phosphate uridylyltransferase